MRDVKAGLRSERYLASVLLAVSLCVGILTAWLTPFSTPMPGYWEDALEFAHHLRIASAFTPDFYPAILGFSLRLLGHVGPVIVQLLMYELFVLFCYRILLLLGVLPRLSAAYALLLGLSPDMLTGISKIWDVVATSAAFVAVIYCLLCIARKGPSTRRSLMAGVAWGLGLAIRPNFLLLILPLIGALWISRPTISAARRTVHAAMITIICMAVMAGANLWAHGAAYWPENGPYNFFAGANELTAHSLLTYQNGEPSIVPALEARGIIENPQESSLGPVLLSEGRAYVRAHPARWAVEYGALKLSTMLRPDTKAHPLLSGIGIARLLMCCGIFVWLILLCRPRPAGWRPLDLFHLCVVVAYCIPFLLTNADPRFGIALNQYLWIVVFCIATPKQWTAERSAEHALVEAAS